ncbi:IF-2B-domain-containing protein, partial [Patellaria atrata CBS 101060]
MELWIQDLLGKLRLSGRKGRKQRSRAQKAMPLRRRMSSGQVPILPQQKKEGRRETREKEKEVGLFGHLYGQPRRHEIAGAPKDIHPAILALGLQTSGYVVSGSNARCVAMLLAFKSLISSYTTPHGTSLARHLTTHLSPQIDYLKSCRPISIAMGNSIRWLKDIIIKIDPAVPESDAKTHLLTSIDAFIRDRITAADTLIAQTAASKIVDGDVILTFARSSIVQKTLLFAHAKGTKFRVLVVDSKPLFEGKRLAKRLADAGVEVRYALITGAAHAAK